MRQRDVAELILAGMAFANVDVRDIQVATPEIESLLNAIRQYGPRSQEARRALGRIVDIPIDPEESAFETLSTHVTKRAEMIKMKHQKRMQGRLGVCEKCRNLMDVPVQQDGINAAGPELLRWVMLLGMVILDPILFEDVSVDRFPEELRVIANAVRYSEWTPEAREKLMELFGVRYAEGDTLFTRLVDRAVNG